MNNKCIQSIDNKHKESKAHTCRRYYCGAFINKKLKHECILLIAYHTMEELIIIKHWIEHSLVNCKKEIGCKIIIPSRDTTTIQIINETHT